jgi:hypothetical protein
MSSEKNHAALGASNSSRWMHCPGSVAAEEPMPDPESRWAQEGTAAHSLAVLSYDTKRDAETWLGEEIEGVVVTGEMVEAIRFYLGYVVQFSGAQLWREKQFNLAPIKPPAEMFGTADFVAYRPHLHHIDIVDLKYGKGVIVTAEGNTQTRYYALGFWIEFMLENRPEAEAVKTITVHIIQPRVLDDEGEPSVTTDTITLAELRRWAKEELLPAARATQEPDAPRVPGPHCRFCRAKGACAEFRGVALAAAQTEFADIPEDGAVVLPAPVDMTVEQIGKALAAAKLLEAWIEGVQVYALNEIERGRPIPGYSLAPKRANRKWKNEAEARTYFIDTMGLPEEDVFKTSFRSPAQIEKLVGKKRFPGDLTVAESSGMKLVRDSDPRALPAGPEFPDAP